MRFFFRVKQRKGRKENKKKRKGKKITMGEPQKNGYILFCEWRRLHLPKPETKEAFADSGRILGQQWQRQTEDQKSWWSKMARRDPSQFQGKLNSYMLFCNVVR